MTEIDPYGDPFAEDIHDPVVFALNGTELLHERAQTARQKFRNAAKNILALSARNVLVEPLKALGPLVLSARIFAGRLRGADEDLDNAFSEWTSAYNVALAALNEVERVGELALTPDGVSNEPPEPPLPAVQDWANVSSQVHSRMLAWTASVRGKKSQTLIAKPSPGTGKTRAMIDAALHEQKQRQRVVIAVRTKQMLVGELEPRVRKSGAMQIRLHVIQGRDESTCWNFDNVKAVQAHGYAPGSTVCSRCEYHPDIARKLRTFSVCPYYRSRQNAQNDTASARFGMNDYPLIATTHTGYLTAVESGGGRFGKFWPCDMLMVDEDPTEAFEPEVVVAAEHLDLPTPPKPEDRAAHAMAALLDGAIAQADHERRSIEGHGFMSNGVPSEIHSKHGSAYAGLALHKLLERVATGPVGLRRGFRSAMQVLRDVSDSHVHPEAGALHGATTAAAVSLVVPPRGLSQIGEALFEEHALRMQLRRIAYKKIHKRDMPNTYSVAQVEAALAESNEYDSAYRVRLEYVKGAWRFVLQNFVNMLDQSTNVIIGDAYANIEHYRQVFDKPRTLASDPTYVDPVTIINHVANFPEGSLIARIRTRANITYLLNEGWSEHAALLGEVFRTHAGQSVLVYGHGVLRERIEKLFVDNDDFGVEKWAFENWGGGRGKDHYGDWDAVVTISDYVQNIGGMLHKVNARAARDTARLIARGRADEALLEGTRIRLDMNKADVAHKMADAGTHWRIKQEHDRQNISELAQALHRVRGLRSAKRMTVIGDGVPFTKDTHAATIVVNPDGGPKGRPKMKSGYVDGFLTEDEVFDGILQIADHYGCWIPVFSHAFLAVEMAEFLGSLGLTVTGCQGVQANLYRDSLSRDSLRPPPQGSPHHPHVMPGVHPDGGAIWIGDVTLSHDDLGTDAAAATPSVPTMTVGVGVPLLPMLQRVWFPPAEWKNLYRIANQRLWRVRAASGRVANEFKYTGKTRVSWEDSTHPGYTWYSRHSQKTGIEMSKEILENQYGINKHGVLYAPNQKPFVPF